MTPNKYGIIGLNKPRKLKKIKLPNGDYDFGVPIYNEVFNNLDPKQKEIFLHFSITKDGKTIYNDKMFTNMINKEVAKALDFNPNNI
jgi:hypothetical protein